MGIEDIEEIKLITFQLAQDIFAVDILKLKEICNVRPMTPVPNTPEFVRGVVNLRGKIVPIVDLRKRFNLKGREISDTNKIMVIRMDDKLSGFIVDAVLDVHELPGNAVDTPSRMLAGFEGKYIKGMVNIDNNLIVVLDIDYILTSSEKIDLSKIINDIEKCYG